MLVKLAFYIAPMYVSSCFSVYLKLSVAEVPEIMLFQRNFLFASPQVDPETAEVTLKYFLRAYTAVDDTNDCCSKYIS